MPTQEERLTIVEYDLKHFKTETIKAYSDMAMERVMVKGLTEDAVKRLMSLRTQIDQRFDTLNAQINDVKQDISEQRDLLVQILGRLSEKP